MKIELILELKDSDRLIAAIEASGIDKGSKEISISRIYDARRKAAISEYREKIESLATELDLLSTDRDLNDVVDSIINAANELSAYLPERWNHSK
jgi:hypothetical protein